MRPPLMRSLARWLVVAVAIVGVNLTGIIVALWARSSVMTGIQFRNSKYEMYDGSIIQGTNFGRVVIRPATTWGLCRVWCPVAVGAGASLLMIRVARTRAVRHWFETVRVPRVTMLRMMAAIGAISVCLWLIRISISLTLCGALVLVLMLRSAHRRGVVAKEIKAEGPSATPLSLAGLAGYSIAVLLALAWVVSIAVWESYQPGRR